MKLELWYPVKPSTVTQPFGVNGAYYQANGINIKGHNGIDLVATHGQPVRASHDGTIYYSYDSREGFGAVVRTLDRREYLTSECFFKTIYWHFCDPKKEPQYTVPFMSGQQVKCGDVIGYADTTGFSTGDHLHFSLKPQLIQQEPPWTWYNIEQDNGYLGAIDPAPYFNGFFAEDAKMVLSKYEQIVSLLGQLWTALKGRNP